MKPFVSFPIHFRTLKPPSSSLNTSNRSAFLNNLHVLLDIFLLQLFQCFTAPTVLIRTTLNRVKDNDCCWRIMMASRIVANSYLNEWRFARITWKRQWSTCCLSWIWGNRRRRPSRWRSTTSSSAIFPTLNLIVVATLRSSIIPRNI